MKNPKQKIRAAWISIIVSSSFIIFQVTIGLATNSLAILADAAHSSLDLAGALITFFAVKLADKPPDQSHNYGHGKVEGLSAMAEVLLLITFCVFIFYFATQRLTSGGVPVNANIYAFGITILSIIVNASRSFFLYRTARNTGSQALEANALHFLSDMWSSVVILFGLIGYRFFGFIHADSIAAIIVSIFVFLLSIKLGKRVINVLLDRAPTETMKRINELIDQIIGSKSLKQLRVRTSGNTIFTDMIITVDPELSIKEAHGLANDIEKRIINLYPNSDITIHIEPKRQASKSSKNNH